MKQTAVEWLYEQILLTPLDIRSINKCLEQAKEMEKEQIIQAIIDTVVESNKIYDKEYPEVRYIAEQYYKQTYESNT